MVVGAKVCELTDDFLWFVCVNFDISPKLIPQTNKQTNLETSLLNLNFVIIPCVGLKGRSSTAGLTRMRMGCLLLATLSLTR